MKTTTTHALALASTFIAIVSSRMPAHATPLFPALRSGHRLLQRPSRRKQIPSSNQPISYQSKQFPISKTMTLKLFLRTASVTLMVLTAVSCSKSDENVIKYDAENPLLGIWVNAVYTDSGYVMKRANAFVDTADGLEFKADGAFLRRGNSGDCGTPPIAYANYEGSFSILDDKSVYIETEYWGGSKVMHLKIVSVDGEKLVYYYLR